MTEERLKEIKDSIDYKLKKMKPNIFLDEQLELYNEVIRLREIIDKIREIVHKFILECELNGNGTLNLNNLDDILKENKNDN